MEKDIEARDDKTEEKELSDNNDVVPLVESTVEEKNLEKLKRLALDLPKGVWLILFVGLFLTFLFYSSNTAVEIDEDKISPYTSNTEMPGCLDCSNGQSQGLFVYEDYLYIADNDAGLTILDISKPDEPVMISQIKTYYSSAMNVIVHGKHAYVAEGMGISIVNI